MPEIRARRRLHAWKWLATVCAMVIAGAWFASRWVWLDCVVNRSDGYVVMVQSGRLWVFRRVASPFGSRPLAVRLTTASETDSAPEWRWQFEARATPRSPLAGNWSVHVPLWALFLLAATPAAMFWRMDGPPKPGVCLKCGYDRAGLAEGAACPECGTKGNLKERDIGGAWGVDLRGKGFCFVCGAWALFMVRTFSFHLGLAAGAVGLGALILGAPWIGAILVAASLLGVSPAVAGLFRRPRNASGAPTLTIMTANLEYGRADSTRLVACIGRMRPDIVLFQEFTSKSVRELPPLIGADFPHRFEHPREDGFGQAIYSRHPLTAPPRVLSPGCDDPQVRAEIAFAGRSIVLVDVHLVPPSTLAWVVAQRRDAALLADLAHQEIGTLPAGGALIIAGDFNATAASPHLAGLRRSGLREAHAAAGRGRGTTWPRRGPLRLAPGIRIDHILFAGGLECIESGVCGDVGSDHRPTFARFVLTG